MLYRGIKKVILNDYFDYSGEKYDTILLLMNGIGIAGTVKKLKNFLQKAKDILNPGGKIIFDSTDVDYMYREKDGSKLINLNSEYYGELIYTMQYKEIVGKPFEWLFIDYPTLASIAKNNGFEAVYSNDTHLLSAASHFGIQGLNIIAS